MIEYILARPFVLLFGILALVFSSINYLYELHYPIIQLKVTLSVLVILFIFFIFNRTRSGVIFLLVISVLYLKISIHLIDVHVTPNTEKSKISWNSVLLVNNANINKGEFIVDARMKLNNHNTQIQLILPEKYFPSRMYFSDTLICNLKLTPVLPIKYRYFNNFNNFLLNEHIYFKARLVDSTILLKKYSGFSINAYSQYISQRCKEIFLKNISDPLTANLMVALLLGDKSSLDKNIKNDFINTGTAHILAVSGLHLGMIYVLLNSLIKLVNRRTHSKRTKCIEMLLLLFLIWFFSFVSGLSESVIRAAVMLTLFEFGTILKRNSDPVNSLFGCGFIMTFCNPCCLYNIGFQLSFMAVLSIILFNPYISRIFNPENLVLSKIRDLLAVTLSVQILVTPISIYYFQQFPIYFILSNLIWVPLSFILMIAGIALILCSLFIPIISLCLGHFCIYLCKAGLYGFELINLFPVTKFEGLWIYKEQVAIYTMSTILIFFWFRSKESRLLIISTVLFLLLPILHTIRIEIQKRNNELIIYSEDKSFQMDLRIGSQIYTTMPNSSLMKKYREAHHIKSKEQAQIPMLSNYLIIKNNILITCIDNFACKEFGLIDLTIKDAIRITNRYSNNSNSLIRSYFIVNKSIETIQSNCLSLSDFSSDSIYELNSNGPFNLKF